MVAAATRSSPSAAVGTKPFPSDVLPCLLPCLLPRLLRLRRARLPNRFQHLFQGFALLLDLDGLPRFPERAVDPICGAESADGVRRFRVHLEAGTGLALIVDPALVIRLLLGTNDFGQLLPVARCFGVALLALGLGCWPSPGAGNGSPALRGMLTYNLLIALFLVASVIESVAFF